MSNAVYLVRVVAGLMVAGCFLACLVGLVRLGGGVKRVFRAVRKGRFF